MSHEADHARVPPLAVEDPSFAEHMELVRTVAPDDGSESERSRIVFAPMNLAHFNHEDRNVAVFPLESLQRLLVAVEIDLRRLTQLRIDTVEAERPFLLAIAVVKAADRATQTGVQAVVC